MKTYVAKKAFYGFRAIKAVPSHDPYDPRSNIVDVVANLFHYAAMKKIDMEDAIRMAREHYIAETRL